MRFAYSLLMLLLGVLGLAEAAAVESPADQDPGTLTNAEKLAKGLPLNRPARLYDAKRGESMPSRVYVKVLQNSNSKVLGYVYYSGNTGWGITAAQTSALAFLLPDTTGTNAQINIPSFGATQFFGLLYDSSPSIGTAQQTGYDPANAKSDGGSPTSSTKFQSSVFTWTSASSALTIMPVTSTGRTAVNGYTDTSATFLEFSKTTLTNYPTQLKFLLAAS